MAKGGKKPDPKKPDKGDKGGKSKMAGKPCPNCGAKLDSKGYCSKCKKQY